MQAVVLAAGASSRFWPVNTGHKSLLRIGGESLLEHTLSGLQRAGVTEVVVVQGPNQVVEQETSIPEELTVQYVVQEEAKGMGDALQQARDKVSDRFVVTGPYRHRIDELLAKMDGAGAAVAGAETEHPERYGMLSINEDQATGIVEKPEGEAPSPFKVVSTYLLDDTFFTYLDAAEDRTVPDGTSAQTPSAARDGVDHEYSFEDALDTYMQEETVRFVALDEEPPSLKYPWELFAFAADILDNQEPSIADTASIADSAVIEGNVEIGENVTVYEHAVIRGPAYIGPDSVIGNGAVVRQHTSIGANSTIGAHAEIRGCVIQDNFSCHSGFIGDSIIDRNVAVGAGAVTANRLVRKNGGRGTISVHVKEKDETIDTGRDRLGAIIGRDADIGTQANLMPGVCIGSGSFIGPSALVRHNIGSDKTYYTKVEGRELERR